MLPFLRLTRTLRFTRPGRLLPWLGPALRGMVAHPFKNRVCVHPPAERDTRWVHCHGCPHMTGCSYGETLEPDPPEGALIFPGQEQAARPVVLSLPFPMPPCVQPGDEFPVWLTFLGKQAVQHVDSVWDALADAGGRLGFDPERTTFTLSSHEEYEEAAIELPASPDGEMVPLVRVSLTGPLFLRSRDDHGKRHHLAEPSFADLLRAGLRTLGGLFALYDMPLQVDFAGLKEAALRVPLVRANYQSFHQQHWSNRSGGRTLHGVMGNGVYGPVPAALVQWLEWAGKVHVGLERIAGAGGWQASGAA